MATANFKGIAGGAGILGNNPDEMNAFGNFLNNTVPKFEEILSSIDTQVSNTTWSGADAVAFADQWDQSKTQIKNQFIELLQSTASRVSAQAQEQIQASTAR